MKKTLLILSAVISYTAQAQLIQNSDFEGAAAVSSCMSGEAHTDKPERAKVVSDDGSWYYCGGVTTEQDGAEGAVLISVTNKTPNIRQTISNQSTAGDALEAGKNYTVKFRVRKRGTSGANANAIEFSFRNIDNLTTTVPGLSVADGGALVLAGNNVQIPATELTDAYKTFEFGFTTPASLPVGSDTGSNGTDGNANTGTANYHEGVVIQVRRPKAGSNTDDDLLIAEISMTKDEDSASIDDLLAYGFSAYPNPANDVLQVSASENIQSVALYSLTGQLVKSVVVAAKSASIDVANLTAGVYVAKAVVGGVEGTFKVVKN